MKRFFIRIIKLIYKTFKFPFKIIYKLLCKLYPLPKNPTVVICMDGGLCSQMFEYAIGELFKENGYLVKFDLNWFKTNGRDVFGKDARFFEINKLYPNIQIKKASKFCIDNFKTKYYTTETNIETLITSGKNIYLVNDHPLNVSSDKIQKVKYELYKKPFSPTDEKNLKIIHLIQEDLFSCAVHVRRGDLANEEIAEKSGYGSCINNNYYKSAISIMKKLIPEVTFYFFSDDLKYVKDILIPDLGTIRYYIVDVNSDSILNGGGYKDFYLIYLCKNQICSLGSFGKDAALLNKNTKKIIISPKDLGTEINNKVILDNNGILIQSTINC